MKRFLISLAGVVLLFATPTFAQQTAPPPRQPAAAVANDDFLRAADEVMEQVSKLVGLPQLSPLKKSLKSREEIREYLIAQLKKDKNERKRHADQRALERFGLLPRDFELEAFLLELLTEQVAGLYDPETQEFYIAGWVPAGEQRMVMAHELVHALQDQHFKVKKWSDAAKPNDDAELARDAVLEGSATAAMLDFMLGGGEKINVRTMPDIGPLIKQGMAGELESNPQMAKAPPFLSDVLLFPYLSGAVFTQHVLRSLSGWLEFRTVFEKPPVSTQQILHPELYLAGVVPRPVALPDLSRALPRDWKKLDENVMGEFGVHLVLKQYLKEERAERLSPSWAGDRYAIFENGKTKASLLVFRVALASPEEAARFFGGYSEALELKSAGAKPRDLFRRPGFFQFATDDGGVFLQCVEAECLLVDGADRATYDRIVKVMRWPAAPKPPQRGNTVATEAAYAFQLR